jgi:hypothetical protein
MSRGMSLHDLYDFMHKVEIVVDPEPVFKRIILPPIPKRYAIKVGSYYMQHDGWTKNVVVARIWSDQKSAEDMIDRRCAHYMDAVDVTDLFVLVSDLWEHFS